MSFLLFIFSSPVKSQSSPFASSTKTFALDFIDIDMWQQTAFEKEVLALLKVENL